MLDDGGCVSESRFEQSHALEWPVGAALNWGFIGGHPVMLNVRGIDYALIRDCISSNGRNANLANECCDLSANLLWQCIPRHGSCDGCVTCYVTLRNDIRLATLMRRPDDRHLLPSGLLA